jgi:poly-gamma-glutamate capsule biosynthesis protein CapA/YwtB (metallophosphatase superfamily)
VALLGLYLTTEGVTGNGVAALPIEDRSAAVSAVKQAVADVGEGADLSFLMLGWHSKTELKLRREICKAMIDEAGVEAVLSHHAGAMEGIEAHGGGLIVHNPGPALLMNIDKDSARPALVYRIHLRDRAIAWVEAQPIEARRKRTKIGMGNEYTHGTIRRLARLSRELGTEVTNENGRGIWEPSAK